MEQLVVKEEGALTKAKDIVAKHPVVVFSKSYCPYCDRAKKLLTSLGAKPEVLELDQEPDGAEIQKALTEWTGQRTVPNVFVGGKHLGGCDDTTGCHRQGKLVPMLEGAGALASSAPAGASNAAVPLAAPAGPLAAPAGADVPLAAPAGASNAAAAL